ncbi:MAG: cell division protein ZipA C-terminal FtsZ-binding domain-containing protein [Pseudomonadota bacterium]
MSELQIGLLVIGAVIVLAIYFYNAWLQRQHRRKFEATFEPMQEDPLYSPPVTKTEAVVPFEDLAADAPVEAAIENSLVEDSIDEILAHPEDSPGDSPAASGNASYRPPAESVCDLLDDATDYIAVLSLKTPASAHALAPLWQQRFDFGKNVYACGLNAATGAWEKVIPESPLAYSAFKLAIQLADRSGSVSEAKLQDFHELARHIAVPLQGEIELPDTAEAAARAAALDSFCAEVDQMIGLNIMPSGERIFSGSEIAGVAERHGMALQSDGAFHLLDEQGHTLFSLGNYENVPFQHHTLEQMWVNGLTLLLDVPRVDQPARRFDQMAVLARQLAMDMRAAVVDDHRVALGEQGFAQIRAQVAAIEERMMLGDVVPGSAQARRLFS